jgi:hypothetical protein
MEEAFGAAGGAGAVVFISPPPPCIPVCGAVEKNMPLPLVSAPWVVGATMLLRPPLPPPPPPRPPRPPPPLFLLVYFPIVVVAFVEFTNEIDEMGGCKKEAYCFLYSLPERGKYSIFGVEKTWKRGG